MAISATDLVFYASQKMPKNDSSDSGGDINSKVRVVFEDIPQTGTITAVSSSTDDSGLLTIYGRNISGAITSESFSLSGTTAVSGSQIFERVLIVTTNYNASGNVSITHTESASGLGTIYQNESGFLRPFYNSIAEAVGGSDKVLYEKIFLKNNNTSGILLNSSISEISSGLYALVDFGLEKSQGYVEYTANRLTAPTGVTNYGNGPSGIPNSDLNPLAYQGVWLRLTLDAGEAATNSYYQLRVQGATT